MTGFDPVHFVSRIGRRLIMEFEDAGNAGTPGLIGVSREHPARVQLAKLLPEFVSIGSGIVIDSYNTKSKQQDIVVFERDFCPIYSINDAPEATYYPVEGVAAVGEVKSTMSKASLFDALDKIKSVKLLKRYSQKEDHGLGPLSSFRPFGSSLDFAATSETEYDQIHKFRDQVYGFIFCNSFAQSPESILDNLIEYQILNGHEYMPNIIISLNNGFVQGMKASDMSLQYSPLTSDSFSYIPTIEHAFAYLVNDLRQHIREGRSVPLQALDRYMTSMTGALPACTARRFGVRNQS